MPPYTSRRGLREGHERAICQRGAGPVNDAVFGDVPQKMSAACGSAAGAGRVAENLHAHVAPDLEEKWGR
jgi:hypothetical protein